MPKFCLLYYKNILDKCILKFFNLYNDLFVNDNGIYVLAKNPSKAELSRIFKRLIHDEVLKCVEKYNIVDIKYYFIIGSCMPKDNLLLAFKDSYFPEKLNKLINSDYQLKYILKEHDIRIDIIKFNQVFIEIFDELFNSQKSIMKFFGKEYKNIFFIKHKCIDCYTLFKIIKSIYGKSQCANLYVEKFKDIKPPIIAINDLIQQYVHNKQMMNKSKQLKTIINDIQDFLTDRIKQINETR